MCTKPTKSPNSTKNSTFCQKNTIFVYRIDHGTRIMVSYHVLARMFMENTRNQHDINVAYQCCSWLQSKNINLRMLHILCCIWYASMIEFTFYRIFSPKKSQRGLSISLSRLNLGKFLQESSEDRKWWIDRDWSSAPDSHRLGQIASIRLRTSPIAWLIISSST